jgi:2-hydroxy-3-keto-5-methylthiopentenyl-1-phosphate phosphatase
MFGPLDVIQEIRETRKLKKAIASFQGIADSLVSVINHDDPQSLDMIERIQSGIRKVSETYIPYAVVSSGTRDYLMHLLTRLEKAFANSMVEISNQSRSSQSDAGNRIPQDRKDEIQKLGLKLRDAQIALDHCVTPQRIAAFEGRRLLSLGQFSSLII